MNTMYILLTELLALSVLIALLYGLNYRKEERHKQTWTLILAVSTAAFVIAFDRVLLNMLYELILDYFPNLVNYLVVLFNFAILAAFLILKSGGRGIARLNKLLAGKLGGLMSMLFRLFLKIYQLLPEKLRKKLVKQEAKSVAFFYEKSGSKVVLKPEWSFAHLLFLLTACIPEAYFLFYLLNAHYGWVSTVQWGLPEYPAVSLLILLELAWFFGGERPSLREGSISGEDGHKEKIAKYNKLYDDYKEQFPHRIIADGKRIGDPAGTAAGGGKNCSVHHYHHISRAEDPNLKLVHYLCEQMNQRGVIVRESHVTLLQHLLEQEHVFIENPNYDEISPVLIAGIHQLLMRGKKMIIVANDEVEVRAVQKWIREGLRRESEGFQYLWQIVPFKEALKQNVNADILIVTTGQLLYPSFFQFLKSSVDVARYEVVLITEASKMFSKYDLVLHTFIWKLEDYLQKMPQQIILSKWYEGLEEEIREVLRVNPKDVSVKLEAPPNLFYFVWKKEGEQWFQSELLPKLTHRRIDAEAIIALPGIRAGIGDIVFLNQEESATAQSIQELIDNRKNLLEFGLNPAIIDSMKGKIQMVDSPLLAKRENHRFVVAKDIHYHFINTLQEWWSLGKQNTFIHIVSPPYLLRDYFADHADYFLENSERVSPLIPEMSDTNWSIAQQLAERLCNMGLTQEELQSYLKYAGDTGKPVVQQLNQFLQSTLKTDLDLIPFLEVTEEDIFLIEELTFAKRIHYKISSAAYSELLPNWFQFYELVTQTGEVLGEIIGGNIYQNYLPGQYHAFHGNLYKIEEVNHFNKTIKLAYESQTDKYTYHQNRIFRIGDGMKLQNDEERLKKVNQYELTFHLYHGPVEVTTDGYFYFDQGINLMDEKLIYTKLSEKEQETYKREYENGNVLVMEWKKNSGTFRNPNHIAASLVFLLNEMFVTLFPHGHAYLKAATPLPEDHFRTEEGPFSDKLRKYLPTVICDRENTETSIVLYFIEDTPLETGMLERLRDKWEDVFELVDDYLFWLLEESTKEISEQFAALGKSDYPGEFDFELTMMELVQILSNNRLSAQRQYAERHLQADGETEMRICDFCKGKFPDGEFIQLDDGRERCYTCDQTGIDTVQDLIPLYDEVRAYFLEEFPDVEIRRDVHVRMESAGTIQALSGETFTPTADFDSRIVGKALMEGEDAVIYIENGAPRLQTLATLAHELTHIWQFEHLNLRLVTLEEIEGHASWVEVHLLRRLGAYKEANDLEENLLARDDEYGNGYRLVLERLKQYPEGATPFDFYR